MKIRVKVKPNARENSIKELEKDYFEVKVSVPPEEGKANRRVIELIAKHLNIPKSKITIIGGEFYREKVLNISN